MLGFGMCGMVGAGVTGLYIGIVLLASQAHTQTHLPNRQPWPIQQARPKALSHQHIMLSQSHLISTAPSLREHLIPSTALETNSLPAAYSHTFVYKIVFLDDRRGVLGFW